MSYEEYVNGEAMELTEELVEETVATEEIPAEETSVEEVIAEEAVAEEILVEDTPVEEVLEETSLEVAAEEILVADAEAVAEEALAVEVIAPAEEEELVIQYSVEESLTEPTVDEDLFEASADEDFDFAVEDDGQMIADPLEYKCDEVRGACQGMVQRVISDLKETNFNPYIRSTTTYRYEILRKSTDTEPVDVFEFQRSSGFSLRAMAITTALVAAADITVGKYLKKKLKK